MDLASLNKEHEEILHQYVNSVKATVFEATESYAVKKFMDFNPDTFLTKFKSVISNEAIL